jgi:hypothetical protein
VELNVNLSFHVYQPFDSFAGDYAVAIITLTLGTTVFFAIAERALEGLFPQPRSPQCAKGPR